MVPSAASRARNGRLLALLLIVAGAAPALTSAPAPVEPAARLDALLRQRSKVARGTSTVIIRASDATALRTVAGAVASHGGRVRRSLPSISAHVAVVPNAALRALASHPLVRGVSLDRVVVGAMERTRAAIGAAAVQQQLGYDGAGVGIAIIDSGVTAWHDDLSDVSGGQRVDRFVDFVNGATAVHDDYGHGTHVAGIIGGNGSDSNGARAGIAPGSRLVVLKVLDGAGRGRVSSVVAAIDYAIANRHSLNLRVINLSIASGVYESFDSDPLTLAAQQAVRAGIVVVAAAGNNGVSPQGATRYRGITAPGNAPWVLTVGGSSHMGTVERGDDTIARFTSRGPSAIDYVAKPDVVAPAVGIESLAAPDSTLTSTLAPYLLPGTVATATPPYLSLSGTSMAAPVVTGTVALMLQANPGLTPNAVKAILQYTAEARAQYDPLTQGAGFVNAHGAVELARHLANPAVVAYPVRAEWSRRLIWGNYLVTKGRLTADASAWALDVIWGVRTTPAGHRIDWGAACLSTTCHNAGARWSWPLTPTRNVVWGGLCGGADCAIAWTLHAVTGTSDGETVVWGTEDDGETVVWGTDEGETVVWGTECFGVLCVPVVWGR